MDGSLTPPLRFPVVAPPAAGKTLPVAPGVEWLRMGLPFALDHINLWLLEDGPGWTIVDTGYATADTTARWERIFAGRLRRIADRPDHRDPPPSGPYRAGRLAHRALAGAVMGQREGVVVRTLAYRKRGRFRRVASRFRPAGRARCGGKRALRRAQQGLSPRRAIGPFELSAACRRAAGRDRRTAMA